MNFLGHLLLTYPHPALTMGNVLGDMMRRSETILLEPGLQHGVALHRDIDWFTDRHAGIRALIAALRARHGKYAPVVVDILMDHVLVQQWDTHAEVAYPEFTQWVYDVIAGHLSAMPLTVSQRLEGMVRNRWIDDYGSVQKLRNVLFHMDRRATFPSQFLAGIQDIEEHAGLFDETFSSFYPEIKSMIASRIRDIEMASQMEAQ